MGVFKKIFAVLVRLLTSEHTVDAVRNTTSVILPIIFFFKIGWPTTGIGVGIGALMICMTDLPGNRSDKFRSAWISVLVFTLVAILTAWSTTLPVLMIAMVVAITFVLTMFGTMGQRMAGIGLMGIILATFTIGLKPKDPLLYGNYIFWGGIWYYLISLVQISIFPYRSLQRVINQTRQSTAALLRLRAQGYNVSASLSGFNQQNIRLHLKLANNHELIRQLLLSDRRAMRNLNAKERAHLERSINLIDLYEQVSAVHYDYPYLRKKLAASGTLPLIQHVIELLSDLLESTNASRFTDEFRKKMTVLYSKAKTLEESESDLLKRILANIDEIYSLIIAILQPNVSHQVDSATFRYRDFLTSAHHKISVKFHLSLNSPILRFSLRLSVLCLIALLLITWFSDEHYSYWLLLTMVIVSRPSYDQTVKRNIERVSGTVIGLLVGWLITRYTDVPWQLSFSVLGLFGFFAFNRVAYSISALCITVAVILCLNVYEGDLWQLVSDRAIFTLVGVLLCLGATFVFPIWNASRLSHLMAEVVKANLLYFKAVTNLSPHDFDAIHQTRLARKLSHQQLSALSEAIQAARKEPLKKQLNWSLIKRVQLFNYQFNVLTATFASLQKQENSFLSEADINTIINNLEKCLASVNLLDLKQPVDLPSWGEQPLHLLEVSNYLSFLLKK